MWTSSQCSRIFVLNGVLLVTLLVRSFNMEQTSNLCDELLKPLNIEEMEKQLFLGRWIVQEAYSTDCIDHFTLRHAKSSWAEFYKDTNTGTLNSTMGHMMAWPGVKCRECCVYHHFHNITHRNNKTLLLNLDEFHSSALIMLLKACDECLTLTLKAHVPGYAPLTYLLVYGLKGKLSEIDLRRAKQQADCLKLDQPFKYAGDGDDFCPENPSDYDAIFPSAGLLSRWYGIPLNPEGGRA